MVKKIAYSLMDQGEVPEFEETLERTRFLQENCSICEHHNPMFHDELVTEPVAEENTIDRYVDIREIESMSEADRWQHFAEILAPCIRCYACRNSSCRSGWVSPLIQSIP